MLSLVAKYICVYVHVGVSGVGFESVISLGFIGLILWIRPRKKSFLGYYQIKSYFRENTVICIIPQ